MNQFVQEFSKGFSRALGGMTCLGLIMIGDALYKRYNKYEPRTIKEIEQFYNAKIKSIESIQKPIIQYKNGEYINSFKSVTEASRLTKIGRTNISNVLSGLNKTAGGFYLSE